MSRSIVSALKYENLTEEQKIYFLKYIYNGVGSREFFINPHDLIFKEAAKIHDFEYFVGGTEERRLIIDRNFLDDCLFAANKRPFLRRQLYKIVAYVYYFFLMMLGRFAWEYYPEPADTWEEFLSRYKLYLNKNSKKTISKNS